MGIEIERKYTVNEKVFELINSLPAGEEICQGYLNSTPERTVRVRIKGQKAYLTIKGQNEGISRLEFEYEIPVEDAKNLLPICEPYCIEKIRFTFVLDNLTWELDVFQGAHYGLIIAELELEDADLQIKLPEWIEKEVSDDPRFYNSNIAKTAGLNF
jgi:adenylate cyclase